MDQKCDVLRLCKLASQIRKDMLGGCSGLSMAAALSIAEIIDECINAPISFPTREAGVTESDKAYPGSPSQRLAFNHGVKWVIDQLNGDDR